MTLEDRVAEAENILLEQGGFFALSDIIVAVKAGGMQSFALGESWAVTQICEFPRRRALDIVFMQGDLEELKSLEVQIVEFARKHGINYLMANGRRGFIKKAFPGWRMASATFVKDLNDVHETAFPYDADYGSKAS